MTDRYFVVCHSNTRRLGLIFPINHNNYYGAEKLLVPCLSTTEMSCHVQDSPTGGHKGVAKTLEKIQHAVLLDQTTAYSRRMVQKV